MRKLALLLSLVGFGLTVAPFSTRAQTPVRTNSSNGVIIGFSAGSASLGAVPYSLPTGSLDRVPQKVMDPLSPSAPKAHSENGTGVVLHTAHNNDRRRGEDDRDDEGEDDETPVPEPSSILLLGSGLAAVTILLRHRQLV